MTVAAPKQRDAMTGSWSAELAGLDALADHLGEQVVDAVDMLVDDAPVALERDDDHLMDLLVVEHDFQRHLVLRMHVATQPLLGADRQVGDLVGHLVAGAEHPAADGLVDFDLGGEETVDVGRRHAEFAGDVGDIGLAVTIVPEQAFGAVENAGDILLAGGVGHDAGGFGHGSLSIYE